MIFTQTKFKWNYLIFKYYTGFFFFTGPPINCLSMELIPPTQKFITVKGSLLNNKKYLTLTTSN